jgi:hypothetical protein
MIILIILGEEYKLWSFSLCSFIHSPISHHCITQVNMECFYMAQSFVCHLVFGIDNMCPLVS